MTTVMQGNLSRSILVKDLLIQMAHERDADLIIISELVRDTPGQGWYFKSFRLG